MTDSNKITLGNVDIKLNTSSLAAAVSDNAISYENAASGGGENRQELRYNAHNTIEGQAIRVEGIGVFGQNTGHNGIVQGSVAVQGNLSTAP